MQKNNGNPPFVQRAAALSAAALAAACLTADVLLVPVLASEGAGVVTSSFRSFYDIVAALASAVGSILLLWNVVEWGITLNSQEGMMQARAFKGIGGALVMILAPQIISGFVF